MLVFNTGNALLHKGCGYKLCYNFKENAIHTVSEEVTEEEAKEQNILLFPYMNDLYPKEEAMKEFKEMELFTSEDDVISESEVFGDFYIDNGFEIMEEWITENIGCHTDVQFYY